MTLGSGHVCSANHKGAPSLSRVEMDSLRGASSVTVVQQR